MPTRRHLIALLAASAVAPGLMRTARAAAAELGITLLALDVWTFNEAARRFFRRQGFEAYNERLWTR